MLTEKFLLRLVKISFLFVFLSFVFNLFWHGSLTFCDSLRGYEIWKQLELGANWNTLNYPHFSNSIYSYYIAWWSPGQWMIPWFLTKIIGSNIQVIQILIQIFCVTFALLGFKILFEKLKFSPLICWTSLLIILTNNVFYWHFLSYNGGDLLLISFFPYFVLFVLKIKKYNKVKTIILYFIVLCLGLFLKNTFVLLAICSLIFIFFSARNRNFTQKIIYTLPYFLVFCLVFLIYNYFHLQFGETPGSAHDYEGFSGIKQDIIGDLTYSFGSPIGIFSRYSILLQKINPVLKHSFPYLNLLQIVPVLLLIIYFLKNFDKTNTYFLLLLYFCIPFFCAITFFSLQNKAVGYEMRHFAPIAFLFIPGLVKGMFQVIKVKNSYILICLFCMVDLGLYAFSSLKIENTHKFWHSYKLPTEDVDLFQVIENYEQKNPKGLLVVEEYWQLSFATKKIDKLVLEKVEEKINIVSGMELEFPHQAKNVDKMVNAYSSTLFILKNNGKLSLKKDFKLEKVKLIKKSPNYIVYFRTKF